MIVRNVEDTDAYDDPAVLRDDEIEQLQKQIRNFRVQRDAVRSDELVESIPRLMKRAHATLEHIYKEILSE